MSCKTDRLIWTSIALALAACNAAQPATPPPHPPADLTITRRWKKVQRAPFVATLTGPDAAAMSASSGSMEVPLKLVIDRDDLAVPLTLKVTLPEGTALAAGALEEQVPGGAGPIERTLVVRTNGRIPPSDVVVRVESSGDGFGAHAVTRYRFGRPEPRLAQPAGLGRPVRINGHSIGQPIPLQP